MHFIAALGALSDLPRGPFQSPISQATKLSLVISDHEARVIGAALDFVHGPGDSITEPHTIQVGRSQGPDVRAERPGPVGS